VQFFIWALELYWSSSATDRIEDYYTVFLLLYKSLSDLTRYRRVINLAFSVTIFCCCADTKGKSITSKEFVKYKKGGDGVKKANIFLIY
jgi:hypothetical protein